MPLADLQFGNAPCSRRNLTTPVCDFMAARCSGVMPSFLSRLGLPPFSINNFTISRLPVAAPIERGVIPSKILQIDLRLMFQEDPGNIDTVFTSSYVQRRGSLAILCIDIGSTFQQHLCHLRVVGLDGPMERRPTFPVIGLIWICPLMKKVFDRSNITLFRQLMKFAHY